MLSPSDRQSLIEAFGQWLDNQESMPPGLDPSLVETFLDSDRSVDLAGAITAIAGEVRLQGKAFKQLAESLSGVPQGLQQLDESLGLLRSELEEPPEAAPGDPEVLAESDESDEIDENVENDEDLELELPQAHEILDVLLDLHPRLERGLLALKEPAAKKPLLQRLLSNSPHPHFEALRQGYQMTLERLEGALASWDLQRFGRVGEPFDPEIMVAIDVASDPSVAEGTVLAVHRPGYRLRGTLLERARVKVSRAGTP